MLAVASIALVALALPVAAGEPAEVGFPDYAENATEPSWELASEKVEVDLPDSEGAESANFSDVSESAEAAQAPAAWPSLRGAWASESEERGPDAAEALALATGCGGTDRPAARRSVEQRYRRVLWGPTIDFDISKMAFSSVLRWVKRQVRKYLKTLRAAAKYWVWLVKHVGGRLLFKRQGTYLKLGWLTFHNRACTCKFCFWGGIKSGFSCRHCGTWIVKKPNAHQLYLAVGKL